MSVTEIWSSDTVEKQIAMTMKNIAVETSLQDLAGGKPHVESHPHEEEASGHGDIPANPYNIMKILAITSKGETLPSKKACDSFTVILVIKPNTIYFLGTILVQQIWSVSNQIEITTLSVTIGHYNSVHVITSMKNHGKNPDNLIVRIWIWLVQRVLLNKKQLAKNAILPRHPNRRVEMQCF
ncbi:hypothetical protein ACJX0J_036388 [Zea mays]